MLCNVCLSVSRLWCLIAGSSGRGEEPAPHAVPVSWSAVLIVCYETWKMICTILRKLTILPTMHFISKSNCTPGWGIPPPDWTTWGLCCMPFLFCFSEEAIPTMILHQYKRDKCLGWSGGFGLCSLSNLIYRLSGLLPLWCPEDFSN